MSLATLGFGKHYAAPYPGVEARKFIPLPVGAVRPEGWLKSSLQAWADGITGHLHEYRSDTFWNTWDNRSFRNKQGHYAAEWWPFEQQAYWAEGMVQLAYILDDKRLKGVADEFINKVLEGQNPDGYIGHRPSNPYSDDGEIYVQSLLCLSLMSYYSATEDARVVPAMQNAFRHIYANCKPVPDEQGRLPLAWRGGSYEWQSASHIIYPILWTYSKTGDEQLLSLAKLVYTAAQEIAPPGRRSDMQISNLLSKGNTLYDMCGVDATEVLRIPAIYYLYSGNPDDLNASIKGIEKVDKYHGQVHGSPVVEESLREPGTVNDTETGCHTTWSATKWTMFSITGDVKYADGVEQIVFNAAPGSMKPDGKAIQYYSAPNQAACTRTSAGAPDFESTRAMFCPDGDPKVLCCIGQSNRVYPNYVKDAMWLASPDAGLAAVCYGPSIVTAKVGKKGKMVTIAEKTNYPFEEKIHFALKSSEAVEFPLYLRVPGWCKDASIRLNGKLHTDSVLPGKIVKIDRLWASGDKVELNLPMKIRFSIWNKASVAVERGPLVYSLKIKHNWKKVGERFPGFPDWEIRPGSAWNYALCLEQDGHGRGDYMLINRDRTPDSYFTVRCSEATEGSNPWEHPPIELSCKAKKVDGWELFNVGPYKDLTPDVPQSLVITNNPEEEIVMVPYGCTQIRITCFPVTELSGNKG